MNTKTLLGLSASAALFLPLQAAAQTPAANPTISNASRYATYNNAYAASANALVTAASVGAIQGYNPPGTAGGVVYTPDPNAAVGAGSGPRFQFIASGAEPGTSLSVLGDMYNGSNYNFNQTSIGGDGVTGVTNYFQYNGSGVQKKNSTINIGNTVKGGSDRLNQGSAYPELYIGATGDAPAGRRYIFNAFNLNVNKTMGTDPATGNPVANTSIFVNNTVVDVEGTLNLTSGRIYLMGATDTVVIRATNVSNPGSGTVTGGSTDAFIDGMMKNKNTAAGTYNFPLGDRNIYSPMTVTYATATSAAGTTLRYLSSTPPNRSNLGTGVASVAGSDYYTVTSDAPAGTTLTVPFFPTSTYNYTYPATISGTTLFLAGYDASAGQWVTLGTTTSSGTAAAGGTVATTLTRSLTGITMLALGSNTPSVLPVKVIAFDAARHGSEALLSWQVAESKGMASYTAERSTDGRTFSPIGTVAVKSQQVTAYSLTDAQPAAGPNYYRIRCNEQDGSATTTAVRTVNFDGRAGSITAGPNPTAGPVVVRFSGADYGAVTITLYNAAGQLVHSETASGEAASARTVDMSSLAAGSYTLRVTGQQGAPLATFLLQRR